MPVLEPLPVQGLKILEALAATGGTGAGLGGLEWVGGEVGQLGVGGLRGLGEGGEGRGGGGGWGGRGRAGGWGGGEVGGGGGWGRWGEVIGGGAESNWSKAKRRAIDGHSRPGAWYDVMFDYPNHGNPKDERCPHPFGCVVLEGAPLLGGVKGKVTGKQPLRHFWCLLKQTSHPFTARGPRGYCPHGPVSRGCHISSQHNLNKEPPFRGFNTKKGPGFL